MFVCKLLSSALDLLVVAQVILCLPGGQFNTKAVMLLRSYGVRDRRVTPTVLDASITLHFMIFEGNMMLEIELVSYVC